MLKALSPIPMVPGKGTLELAGAHSPNVFTNPEQELYIQLSETERFGIAKLTPRAACESSRISPSCRSPRRSWKNPPWWRLSRHSSPTASTRSGPSSPSSPGEYAVIEYTEGKLNIQIWDFAIQPAK